MTKPQRSLPRLLEHIRDLSVSELDKLFTKMLDEADDVLFDLADKALSNKDQTRYFDSMRELRIKRKGMEKVFSRELHNNFLLLQDTEEPVQENNLEQLTTDSLSLVHEDELEESLAVEAMVVKASAINKIALRQMVTRFDTLLANVRVTGANNPLSPRVLCETFCETAKPLEMDIKTKLVVYKLFDRIVVARLDHVFNEINSFLVNSGVLPDLKSTASGAYKNPQAHPVTATSNTEEPVADVGSEYLGTLRGLLTEQKTGVTMVPQGMDGSAPLSPHVTEIFLDPVVNNNQLVHALSTVQLGVRQQPASGQGHFPVADLRNQIGKALAVPGPVSSETIGQDSDDVIDIIAMLFDYILDDQNLPDEFKALIGRLQIPMLKVALIDETFFSKGNHPARKLLNEMAHAGVGWTVGGGVGLRDKVEEIVSLIVNDFDDDTSLFVEALNNFQQFNEQHQKRASLIEKRIQEAEEGKAKATKAKSASTSALKKVVASKQLPQAIHNFIFSDWLNVMLLTHLLEGSDSKAWENQLQTAEQLMASFIPAKTKASKKQLTELLPGLIENIQSGLEAVGQGEYESEQFFDELERIHHRALKGETIFLEENQVIEIAPAKEPAAEFRSGHALPLATVEELEINQPELEQEIEKPPPGSYFDSSLTDHGSIQEDDQFMDLVENLQAGSWFERTNNEKASRCKLAAVISSIGKYIFVNHTGKKIAEYTKVDLALAFRREEITQLDDGVLFDRALKSIVTDFRTKKYQDAGM